MLQFFARRVCPLPIIYVIIFLLSLHFALPIYITSSFLEDFVPHTLLGALYAAGSLATLASMAIFPAFVRRFGDYRSFLIVMGAEAVALLTLAFSDSPAIIIGAFIVAQVIAGSIILVTDIFLETCATAETVGRERGTALSAGSAAFLVGPPVTGLLLTNGDYWKVFLAATAVILPIVMLARIYLRSFADPSYVRTPYTTAFLASWRTPDLRAIFMSSFTLNVFYAWMVIFMPIYLHAHLGFSWGVIGFMFFIMLIPFVLLEAPLGIVADRLLGEKELLMIGMIIMAVSCAAMAISDSHNPAWWTFLLFVSRIGASTVEVMSETYFFKKITGAQSSVIGFFRNARALAYIIGPAIASIFLIFFPLHALFGLLGVITLSGAWWSSKIHDTR